MSFRISQIFKSAAFAILLCCGALSGQSVTGDLAGTVRDSSGALIPDASIALVNIDTGSLTTTRSNGAGQFQAARLAIGSYTLRADHPGFAPISISDISVELNKIATVNVVLDVAHASAAVTVRESAPLLDTNTAQLQDTFGEHAADSVPLAATGFGVLNLSLLSSGVAGNGGVGVGVGPSVGGQRPRNNNFTVEGVDNNDKLSTGPKVILPTEAVAEFSVLKNQFTAEFGHSSGGQFNVVVRSGGNEVHGTLYEYLQNRSLNAVDLAFQRQGVSENPRRDENRFGGAVGGPIVRNKWFYFANYEYSPIGEESTPAGAILAPTADGFASLSAIGGLSQNNLSVLKQYVPAAATATTSIDVNGVAVPFGPLSIVAPNYRNASAGVLSTDYTVSERDQVRARFIYNRNSFLDTQGVSLPAFYVGNAAANYLLTVRRVPYLYAVLAERIAAWDTTG